MWFLYFSNKKRNNVNRNKVNNNIYVYNIEDNKESFKKIDEVVNKREYTIYRQNLYIIDTCRIIEEDSSSITVQIDLIEHGKLLGDITAFFFCFFKLRTRKIEEKFQHAYMVGNPFLTLKIYNGFW